MECPHCQKELPGKKCPECDTVVPLHSHYCLQCGVHLEDQVAGQAGTEEDLELDDRILCPDGTCTGIIVEGRCSECGKPYGDDHTHEA